MTNATSFWGDNATATVGCANPATLDGTPGTCNGNGDKRIANGAAAGSTGEPFQFWVQLAYAGLIEGSYSGLAGPSGVWHAVIKANVPASKYPGTGWGIMFISPTTNSTSIFDGPYGNTWMFGAESTGMVTGMALKPEDAWNVDTKIDDGKPAAGKVWAGGWSTCTVPVSGAASSANLNVNYNLAHASTGCSLMFMTPF